MVLSSCPAAEQDPLPVKGDGLAGEATRGGGGQVPGGVGQDDLLAAGEAKNCRSTVSRRLRALGRVDGNASMSCTSASAQSCLPRRPARNLAGSRTMARAVSMV